MDDAALRQLPKVKKAFDEAEQQARSYRRALGKRHGDDELDLRSYAVVAVGLERILGEEIGAEPAMR